MKGTRTEGKGEGDSNPLDPHHFFERSTYDSLFKELSGDKPVANYQSYRQIPKKPEVNHPIEAPES